jgi:phosphoribosylformylglycinamidine synthase
MTILHYYRASPDAPVSTLAAVNAALAPHGAVLASLSRETCFNVDLASPLSTVAMDRLRWLISETFEADKTTESPHLSSTATSPVLEFGPRLTFCTAFSSNAVEICKQCGIDNISRFEKSARYQLNSDKPIPEAALAAFKALIHDRMTEMPYPEPIASFDAGVSPEPIEVIPIMTEGKAALERINNKMGLGFDDWDLDYYTDLFKNKLKRDPTDVECFDMGQSNSEHSRHWFFGGKMVIDGEEKSDTLFRMVKDTLKTSNDNSVIAFHDNSSAIHGYDDIPFMKSSDPSTASPMKLENLTLHPILTAETHNFPCGVAPFPGAETGTGGRLRDVQATGRGAHSVAGVSSYCVGNLNIPNYDMPWEDKDFAYPSNMASPLEIEVEASNGASDYGNKYGEPVITGFTRSFGQRLPNGERFEWIKPIMFSAGVGSMDGRHVTKGEAAKGMLVVKMGGPAYRIGVGGGSASSRVTDSANADLDFNAVQRGDAEMENRMNRLMRACIEMGDKNPIISVHDQGCGGNGNVLKEIVEPAGAVYDIRKILVGDNTMSVLEIFGAEYQENNACLIAKEDEAVFLALAARENCPVSILGEVSGDGRVVVTDSASDSPVNPVDLPLELVLGKMPQKTFVDNHVSTDVFRALDIPADTTVRSALDRVLRNLAVGSKRFLVHKVDRSVSGLIAQQPCVGPLQIPLANCGVIAHSHFGTTGTIVAVGEQPIKGLVDAGAMARMTIAEAMTNIMWAKLSAIEDIKASGNWMYAAKLSGEGAKMWDACVAMRDSLMQLGVGIDGGKDSLSMAAKVGSEVVKAPGELVLTCYVTCPDIRLNVTPDLKRVGSGLIYVRCGDIMKSRMGGTIIAQCYSQVGNEVPDMSKDDFDVLKKAVSVTQELLGERKILAGHDRSDGGLMVTLLEMAFSGNVGLEVDVDDFKAGTLECLFNEEAGFVIEVEDAAAIKQIYDDAGVPAFIIGKVCDLASGVKVAVNGAVVLEDSIVELRDVWEETSFQLEKRQRDPEVVQFEQDGLKSRKEPKWQLTYTPTMTAPEVMSAENKPKVAILRQEGTNGDREMSAAFMSAGFEPWDVNVADLLTGRVRLEQFRGIVACGGFSYADTLDSAKGWGGVIRFNEDLKNQFDEFRARKDTFGLGICNGCQLFALMGFVPSSGEVLPEEQQPRLVHNESGR